MKYLLFSFGIYVHFYLCAMILLHLLFDIYQEVNVNLVSIALKGHTNHYPVLVVITVPIRETTISLLRAMLASIALVDRPCQIQGEHTAMCVQ